MSEWILGIIGGSGLYNIEGLENKEWISIDSPWGSPSDSILFAEINGIKLRFLPRHGRGHNLTPSDINYRANIDVLKRAGCTDLLSLSAVGSLREDYRPGDFVVIDQFIDRTFKREKTFFGKGLVAHVSLANPVCNRLAELVFKAAHSTGVKVHNRGTYLVMEGPQFSTKAESNLYRSWGCDVIGMTNMPEAKLAREAELPYASVGMVTDYDCWREGEDNVDVAAVIKILNENALTASKTVSEFSKIIKDYGVRDDGFQGIERNLDFAIITPKESRDSLLVAKLDAIAGRVLN
ncbi:S-methyl-5'-thioadenosine phosphorylase [Hellea sp.]|jgi:5'-methylthioadenosine phosphorylase|nr:S-methyl-5'-thioadenosine phosphorylase [Hellea sp.]MDA8887931.1 S-methyl-5'-thioadenosine phosphorylase [Hellea sp.]MDA8997011.1 S-methyl-5'-thioadenosine phosphorylase [Hellea sp.]MDB4845264.1 S-methyl-5'-thioadenosine phosphorylase [Hellea sp.]MDC0422345.1 S-methyl-5'-thioadenosine phosphorylase [Hellea sp.]MDC0650793.1 S-methyl-5'-thioadenosine phosphorylase [Hellea sp.]